MRYLIYIVILVILVAVGIPARFYILKKKKPNTNSKTKTLGGNTAQLATIFGSIEDGLILIDSKGTIVLCNTSAGTITGWNVEDTIGINIEVVVKLTDPQGNIYSGQKYPFNKVLGNGQSMKDNSMDLINREDKKTAVGLSISPLKDDSGTVTGAVALIRNITDEKEQESRLADFISTASHEMRTPVAAIEGYLALSLNNKVATIDDRARDYIEKAEAATRHLGTLFQDLLTSAKAEDGRLVSHPEVVELAEFLKKLTEDLKFASDKHGLSNEFIIGTASAVKTALPQSDEHQVAPLYYVYVDPDRLREVVTNLFDNAVKFTSSGKITVGITGDDQVVQFYVRDTGVGIPSEDIPHLFQKFYRVDNSATRTIGGNGLGLFICRKIVELYAGRIWVESEEGKGSTFYINLPRLSSQKATDLLEHKSDTIAPTINTT